MVHMKPENTIHIIEGDPVTSEAIQYLLATFPITVNLFKTTEAFLKKWKRSEKDIVLLELDDEDPTIFKFLTRLLYASPRPRIIVTVSGQSVLESNDLFPGEHIKILFHPLKPGELLGAVSDFC